MTAATKSNPVEARNHGGILPMLMKASTQAYAGALAMLNTSGTVEPAADGATARGCVGVFTEDKLSAASGSYWINVQEAEVKMAGTTLAQADVGLMHWATDDLTIDDVPGLNSVAVGPMTEYVGASEGWFWTSWKNVPLMVQNKVRHHVPVFQGLLATIADGDMLTDWTPGFVGEIVGLVANTNVAASTADKLSNIHAEIGATATTGGVLALTTAGLDTIGKVVTSSAIAAGSVFGAADTLSVVAADTTAFIEGEATISLILDQFLGA